MNQRIFFLALCGLSTLGVLKGDGIRLIWDAGLDKSVAGYNIYRSLASGGPYVRLNPSLLKSPFYRDDTAQIGQSYYFVVTSVDASGRESPFSEEIEGTAARNAPVASAASDLRVESGQMVILSGSGWDQGVDQPRFSWSQSVGPPVSLLGEDGAEAVFLAPEVSEKTEMIFQLRITAEDGRSQIEKLRVYVDRPSVP